MSASLIEKIRQSRGFQAEVGEIVFIGTLPSKERFFLMGRDSITDAELARNTVEDWRGVKESDLIEGGSDELVPFDKALFAEIIGDRPEWWRAITDVAIKRLGDQSNKKEAAEKNSRSGSKAKA